MTLPKVSVVVPVFNGERFIGEALASLRREQNVEAEIIVVDDGSTDGSVSIAVLVSPGISAYGLQPGNTLLFSIAMTYVLPGGSHVRSSSSRPTPTSQPSWAKHCGLKR